MTAAAPRLPAPAPAPGAFDVIILGAGISGLTAARRLADQGLKVAVVENYPQPGGNHLSAQFGGCTFDMGALFFWPDNPQFELFPEMRALCVDAPYSVGRLAPDGRVLPYPFSFGQELLSRPLGYMARVLFDVIKARLSPRTASTAADYARRHIGNRIFEDSGLDAYIARFYGVPADKIDIAFARDRMGWIGANASFRKVSRLISRHFLRPPPSPPAIALTRPAEGFPRF